MRIKLGLAALALVLTVGCKTTRSTSETVAVGGGDFAVTESNNLGFETAPNYIDKKVVILTFDDGVDAINTPKVLDVLNQKNVKASFFINASSSGSLQDPNIQNILKRIVNEGHELANHTASHLSLPTLSAQRIDEEITIVENLVKQIVGKRLTLIRAPFGEPLQTPGDAATYRKVVDTIARHGVHIGWNLDSDDWRCSTSGCVTNVSA